MKILFTGGGTAGHIIPIIAVVRELRKAHPQSDLQLFYMGPKDNFGSALLSQEGIKIKTVFAGKVRRYFGIISFFQNIFDIFFKTPIGIVQAFFYVFFLAPDVIFSKGGYGSFPIVFSGRFLKVPIFLHESDVIPGLANRILAKFALEIFVSFPAKQVEYFSLKKMISVGNPIRKEILEGSLQTAKTMFGLSGERPLVLILGGSQGAQRINDIILQVLPEMLTQFEVIHQCGEKNLKQVKAETQVVVSSDLEKHYHLFPFLKDEELKHAYAASDLIISRAGSNAIFEIAALGKPSILLPLQKAAQNHQLKNAYAYTENGAGLTIEDMNLTPYFFLEKLKFSTFNPRESERMQRAALEFAKPQAAKIVAGYLLEYLK